MKKFLVCAGLLLSLGTANAQTATPPAQDAPSADAAAADSSEKTNVPMSKEDLYILSKGEVSRSRYALGTVLSIFPGFGVGHAVNKQFAKSGWIFLAGEGAAAGVMFVGVLACFGDSLFEDENKCSNSLVDIGGMTFLGFKIWEVVDAITRPPKHNARYRELVAERKGKSALFLVPRFDSVGANLVYTF